MASYARIAAICLLLSVPSVTLAEPQTFGALAKLVITLLNAASMTLVAVALVFFLGGAAYNVMKAGERGSGALRTYLLWGVIALFVMVSIWGILAIMRDTIFGSDSWTMNGGTGSGSSAP